MATLFIYVLLWCHMIIIYVVTWFIFGFLYLCDHHSHGGFLVLA